MPHDLPADPKGPIFKYLTSRGLAGHPQPSECLGWPSFLGWPLPFLTRDDRRPICGTSCQGSYGVQDSDDVEPLPPGEYSWGEDRTKSEIAFSMFYSPESSSTPICKVYSYNVDAEDPVDTALWLPSLTVLAVRDLKDNLDHVAGSNRFYRPLPRIPWEADEVSKYDAGRAVASEVIVDSDPHPACAVLDGSFAARGLIVGEQYILLAALNADIDELRILMVSA